MLSRCTRALGRLPPQRVVPDAVAPRLLDVPPLYPSGTILLYPAFQLRQWHGSKQPEQRRCTQQSASRDRDRMAPRDTPCPGMEP